MAGFEEIYLNDFDAYGSVTDIQTSEPRMHFSKGVTLTVVHIDGKNGYCLSAQHSASSSICFYDSLGGGLQAPGTIDCPTVTTGVGGGSITG